MAGELVLGTNNGSLCRAILSWMYSLHNNYTSKWSFFHWHQVTRKPSLFNYSKSRKCFFTSRSISIGIVNALVGMAFALTQKTFPTLITCLTFHGTFYLYAGVTCILTIWATLTIKPTDGLSLVETEQLYDTRTARKYASIDTSKNDVVKQGRARVQYFCFKWNITF